MDREYIPGSHRMTAVSRTEGLAGRIHWESDGVRKSAIKRAPNSGKRNPNYMWTFGQFYDYDYAVLDEELAKFEEAKYALFERYNTPKWFKKALSERVLSAVPVSRPPRIDGRLDEQAWKTAPKNEHFVNSRTSILAGKETEARILYDQNALYVGYTAYEPGANRIGLWRTARAAMPTSCR